MNAHDDGVQTHGHDGDDCAHVRARVHAHAHVCVHVRARVHAHAHVHGHVRANVCIHVHGHAQHDYAENVFS